MEKLLEFIHTPYSIIYLIMLGIYILIALLFLNVARSMKKNEKIKQDFIKTVKSGDECKIYSAQFNKAKVVEINGDEVTVMMTVNKNIVYPNFK